MATKATRTARHGRSLSEATTRPKQNRNSRSIISTSIDSIITKFPPDSISNSANRLKRRWSWSRKSGNYPGSRFECTLVWLHDVIESDCVIPQAKFMQNAVDELTRCRRSLKWSYAMAYFLEKGNEKEIFEDLQAYVKYCISFFACSEDRYSL